MTNENWTDIHKDFGKISAGGGGAYQKLWKKENFTYQDAKEWIKVGFKPQDYWGIKKWRDQGFESQTAKEWIREGFKLSDYQEVWKWKNYSFTPQQAKFWREVSLEKQDYEFAAYLRGKDHQPTLDLNLKQLKEEFNAWLKKPKLVQEYLDSMYPKEKRKETIELNIREKNLFGELELSDFVNLEYLNLSDNNFCQDLSFLSGLVGLKNLSLGNNKLYGSLGFLKELNKLELLDISDTDIDSGLEFLSSSLEKFYCLINWRKDAKVKAIYNLFANEKGEVETIDERITNFPIRLQLFKNWTSGNAEIDKFIKQYQLEGISLEWISYEQFNDIEYLAQGGFGKVYKAKLNDKEVVLKILNESQNIKEDFLQEIANHKLFDSNRIVKCFGISQDPETENYLMVMDYIKDGDLRKFLQNNRLDFKNKLNQLWKIANGLKDLHQKNLVHRDFHSGNILNKKGTNKEVQCYITDLGLCRPANEDKKEKIYGALPYIAPELFQDRNYTRASDIYSFGIVAYEILSGFPPYYDIPHDEFLAVWICQGVRPSLDELLIPQLLKDLIQKCWDADPKNRPTVDEIKEILHNWCLEVNRKEDTGFTQQVKENEKTEKEEFCQFLSKLYQQYKNQVKKVESREIEKVKRELFSEFCKQYKGNKKEVREVFNEMLFRKNSSYQTHPSAVYTSRFLDFKNLPKSQNSKEVNNKFYFLKESGELESLRIISNDLTKEMNHDWQNIHFKFNEELIQKWQNCGFNSQQCKEWVDISSPRQQFQEIQESEFYAWLRDEVKITAEQVLNDHNLDFEDLKEEFKQSQQTLIVQPSYDNK